MIYIYSNDNRTVCTMATRALSRAGIRSEIEPSLHKPRTYCVAVAESDEAKARKILEETK